MFEEIKSPIELPKKQEVKNEDNVFLTDKTKMKSVRVSEIEALEKVPSTSLFYTKFLTLANECFGKEKHYKKVLPLHTAYKQLKFTVKSTIGDGGETKNYMKNTISKSKVTYDKVDFQK